MLSRRAVLLTPLAAAALAAPRRLILSLSCGSIGVKANQRQALEYAARYGFESIEASAGELAAFSGAELDEFRAAMKKNNIGWAIAGMPVDFRGDEAKFEAGMKTLPGFAATLRKAGVTRVTTWISPGSGSLTYNENFRQHVRRLREVAQVVGGEGCRFGLEYVGPKTSWTTQRYPFIHSMREMKELLAAINHPAMGFVLDSWHWYTAHETVADLKSLTARDVVSIDLNDAPAGLAVDEQKDSSRELPCATGVIDVAGFLGALHELGCDAPLRCEPFNEPLRRMAPEAALETTITALKKALSLARV
jgi:sugar phosphate isomerase/epimerase